VPNFAHTPISQTVVLLLVSDELWRLVIKLEPYHVITALFETRVTRNAEGGSAVVEKLFFALKYFAGFCFMRALNPKVCSTNKLTAHYRFALNVMYFRKL
jgi:hypothetical protein